MSLMDRGGDGRGITTDDGGGGSVATSIGASAPTRTTTALDNRPTSPQRVYFDRTLPDARDPIAPRGGDGRGVIFDRWIAPARDPIAPRDGGVLRTFSDVPPADNPNQTGGGSTPQQPIQQDTGSQTFAQFFDSLLRNNSGGNAKRDPAELLYVPSESGGGSGSSGGFWLLVLAGVVAAGYWYYKKHHKGE